MITGVGGIPARFLLRNCDHIDCLISGVMWCDAYVLLMVKTNKMVLYCIVKTLLQIRLLGE